MRCNAFQSLYTVAAIIMIWIGLFWKYSAQSAYLEAIVITIIYATGVYLESMSTWVSRNFDATM